MKCKIHSKYKAVRKPTGSCEGCWYVWFHTHGWSKIPWQILDYWE